MDFRIEWEKITGKKCIHTYETICGETFKYFDIEYVKWLERSDNYEYRKCENCGKQLAEYCENCYEEAWSHNHE